MKTDREICISWINTYENMRIRTERMTDEEYDKDRIDNYTRQELINACNREIVFKKLELETL